MDEIGGDPGAALASRGAQIWLDKGDRLLARAQAQIEARLPLPEAWRSHVFLSSRSLLLTLAALLLLLILPPLLGWTLRRTGRVEANFRGERVLQSYGVVIVAIAGLLFGLRAELFPALRAASLIWLVGILGFGALGLLDDVRGDKRIKGLGGHFQAAFQQRVLTTGFIKAVGGVGLSLGLAHHLHPNNLLLTFLGAAIIALFANAVNLLDLRPGRAGAAFLFLALILLVAPIFQSHAVLSAPPLLYLVLPALVVWNRDARATVMMGDAGSNPLGAGLGLAVAATTDWRAQIVVLGALMALHLVAERVSLTRLIENNPLLRALDRLTGSR